MTAKYAGAVDTARRRSLPVNGSQEELYTRLQKAGCFWNSDTKRWEEFDLEDADEPTKLIMVRVWADEEVIQEAADDVIRTNKKHWELVERSEPFRCRPPKQREARVYLKFLPRRRSNE